MQYLEKNLLKLLLSAWEIILITNHFKIIKVTDHFLSLVVPFLFETICFRGIYKIEVFEIQRLPGDVSK